MVTALSELAITSELVAKVEAVTKEEEKKKQEKLLKEQTESKEKHEKVCKDLEARIEREIICAGCPEQITLKDKTYTLTWTYGMNGHSCDFCKKSASTWIPANNCYRYKISDVDCCYACALKLLDKTVVSAVDKARIRDGSYLLIGSSPSSSSSSSSSASSKSTTNPSSSTTNPASASTSTSPQDGPSANDPSGKSATAAFLSQINPEKICFEYELFVLKHGSTTPVSFKSLMTTSVFNLPRENAIIGQHQAGYTMKQLDIGPKDCIIANAPLSIRRAFIETIISTSALSKAGMEVKSAMPDASNPRIMQLLQLYFDNVQQVITVLKLEKADGFQTKSSTHIVGAEAAALANAKKDMASVVLAAAAAASKKKAADSSKSSRDNKIDFLKEMTGADTETVKKVLDEVLKTHAGKGDEEQTEAATMKLLALLEEKAKSKGGNEKKQEEKKQSKDEQKKSVTFSTTKSESKDDKDDKKMQLSTKDKEKEKAEAEAAAKKKQERDKLLSPFSSSEQGDLAMLEEMCPGFSLQVYIDQYVKCRKNIDYAMNAVLDLQPDSTGDGNSNSNGKGKGNDGDDHDNDSSHDHNDSGDESE
jgi:hypothetical protein